MIHTQEVLKRTHSISNILTHLKWASMPGPLLKFNFTDNQCIDEYRSLFATTGEIDMDNGLDIARVDYNLVIAFLDLIHLPLFVMKSLKEMEKK